MKTTTQPKVINTANPVKIISRQHQPEQIISSVELLSEHVLFNLCDSLNCDPDATKDGVDHWPREVLSGHYVPVKPLPLPDSEYLAHSESLFDELGFSSELAHTEAFRGIFSGDLSQVPEPMRKTGWACGYALSIYGTQYTQQCPFKTGNGYGDGRAISVFELSRNGLHYEFQLKGAGKTPYCRGADGRSVLRSSIREFIAQEHMHALGVPTSRSLSLFVSKSEQVRRPWYSEATNVIEPDTYISEPVAISTRVAPSFIRVGQLELFSRRARAGDSHALRELEQLVLHLIDREYSEVIDAELSIADKVFMLSLEFSKRLTSLVANWIRVGYCQGNFNSDNCAAGGFTLDYGPFGFCDVFDPVFQPWTGGGKHFSFLNQPKAAELNFHSFCAALCPLLRENPVHLSELQKIRDNFPKEMNEKLHKMWASKLGMESYDAELTDELQSLLIMTTVDYTLFFRELSHIPDTIEALKKSFYAESSITENQTQVSRDSLDHRWAKWLSKWHKKIGVELDDKSSQSSLKLRADLGKKMKAVNPKYTMREWLVMPAYKASQTGQHSLLNELLIVMTQPYEEQAQEIEQKYYRLKPNESFNVGGISHYSCSS